MLPGYSKRGGQLLTVNRQLPTAILGQPKYLPHYTVADYQQWSGDWELWEGVAVAMTPSPFGKHQKAITRLAQMLLNELDRVQCGDCEVAVELDWIIDTDLVVRPDISLCCGSNIDKYIESPPKFIAEVLSQSTQIKDRTAKFDLYAKEGVKYYAIVDLDGDSQCYELQSSRYEKRPNGAIELQLSHDCAISIDLQKL